MNAEIYALIDSNGNVYMKLLYREFAQAAADRRGMTIRKIGDLVNGVEVSL